MIYLKQTENLFISLDREYQALKENGVLATVTPTAFVSFLIIRLTCEFEACLHKMVKDKWKQETKSTHIHQLIQEKIKLRSSKSKQLRKNLNQFLLDIDNPNVLFPDGKSRIYYEKIFGKEGDETGENNIRNQIAHQLDFVFSFLPQWDEIHDYIQVADNVLQYVESNLKFID